MLAQKVFNLTKISITLKVICSEDTYITPRLCSHRREAEHTKRYLFTMASLKHTNAAYAYLEPTGTFYTFYMSRCTYLNLMPIR